MFKIYSTMIEIYLQRILPFLKYIYNAFYC